LIGKKIKENKLKTTQTNIHTNIQTYKTNIQQKHTHTNKDY